ncbi:MAG: hypothetical protein NC250_02890 [Alistipes senegalensis]|nr:hypothetical protein [Bacteroides cellulosilyticus]MCM1351665.1 hypothetical protein [Alistipes senegalensis]
MNYFVRSVKFFCAASVLALLLIVAMVATGMAAAEWNDWHRFAALFGMLALLAAVYPKLTFVARLVACDLAQEGKQTALDAFRKAGYELIGEAPDGTMTFRPRTFLHRLRMLFDDEIRAVPQGDRLRIEGHRNGVYRVLYRWDAYASYDDAR